MKPLTERPALLAFAAFAILITPLALGWQGYSRAQQQNEERLFQTTADLLVEQLRLAFVRHVQLFNILRNRLLEGGQPRPMPAALRASYPYLRAYGYAVSDGTGTWLRWVAPGGKPPVPVGANLETDPARAAVLARAAAGPMAAAGTDPAGGPLVFVAARLPAGSIDSAVVVGWVDAAGLIADPVHPLLAEHRLAAGLSGSPPSARAVLRYLREAGAEVPVVVTRGNGFQAAYGGGSPTMVFATGLACAVLLSLLVYAAVRAAVLRGQLAAERSRGALVRDFSHQFRTPLGVILSCADLLATDSPQLGPGRRAEALEDISLATTRLSRMVDDILQLSRLESHPPPRQPDLLELQTFCAELATAATAGPDPERTISVNAGGRVSTDRFLLQTALENLLANALKYSPATSQVRFDARVRQGSAIFRVTDEGMGVPHADLPHIGEPFRRGANAGRIPGTGLGLAITRRCAVLLGGKFSLESREGSGTVATLTIPAT